MACFAALVVAVLLGYALIRWGADPRWQLALFTAVIVCIVARRCVPMSLNMSSGFGGFTWLWLILIFNVGRISLNAIDDSRSDGGSLDGGTIVIGGGLLFVAGMVIAVLRWLPLTQKQRQPEYEMN